MNRQLMLGAATALLATVAAAQTSSIPDPSSPAPTTEDRATPAEIQGTTVRDRDRKRTTSGAFNAVESAGGTLGDRDVTFVKKAASIGAEEVEAGKAAADQASDAKVKDFAQQMVTDHSQANDELKGIVEKKGISLPAGPQGEQATALTQLKAKKGADFDRAFVAENVKGHREAVRLFTRAAKNAKDPEVKSFAEKTLPTLKHHLEMAESLQQSLSTAAKPMSKSKKEPVPATDTRS